jgi:HK97 family phage portal protein
MGILFGGGTHAGEDMASWLYSIVRPTTAGEPVSEQTALQLSAYYACIRVVAEDVAKLPLHLHQMRAGARARISNHHVIDFLAALSPYSISQAIREHMTALAAGWGFCIAEIQRDTRGRPSALHPVHSSRVEPHIIDGALMWRVHIADCDIFAQRHQRRERASEVWLDDADVFCLRGMGTGLTGYSVLRLGAESLGMSLAAQTYGAAWFGNGATPSVVIKHPAKLSAPAADNLRRSWAERHQGAAKSNKPAVLEEGMDLQTLGVPPEESQFLQTRQFQVEEVCRWFRVPPVKIGHNQDTPYSNVESLNLAYVNDSLTPWLIRWEQEAGRKLLTSSERAAGYFFRHNVNALLRGDSQARSAYLREMIHAGVMSVNESRATEDLPPVPGGDAHYLQQGMTTLPRIAAGENTAGASSAAEPEGRRAQAAQVAPSAAARLLEPIICDAAERILRREVHALAKACSRYGGDAHADAFAAWAAEFYERQRAVMAEILSPIAASWCALTGQRSDLQPLIEAHCRPPVQASAQAIGPAELAARITAALQKGSDDAS